MATMEAAMAALASSKKLSALAITIKVLHYVYPALVFFTFIFALALTVCTVQTRSLRVKDQHVRRDIIFGILIAVVCTYFAEAIVVLVNSSAKPSLAPTQDRVVYLIASVLIFGLQILVLFDAKFPVWYPYYSTWFLGIAGELTLLITRNIGAHPKTPSDFVVIGIQILRIIGFILLPTLYFQIRNSKNRYGNDDAERQSLLAKKLAPKPSDSENSNGYGGTDSTDQQTETGDDAASDAGSEDSWLETQRKAQDLIQKRLENDGNWWTYAKGFSIFFPLIWPLHDNILQFRAILVGLCLLATNAFNVLVPRQLGIMIDTLTKYASGEDRNVNIWLPVITYTVLLFISGGACIGWLRKWLWLPLEQYSYDALSTASHAHIMSLSSDFHDSKTSSDLSQAIAGGRSVSDLLDTVCFQVLPMFIDLSVAFAYLWSLFGPYMGFIMATTTITYLYVTTKMVASRAEKRREFITVYRKEWTVGQQSLDGWTTASLFNMIPYERKRYQSAVKDHMQSKKIYELSTQASGAAQGLVMTFGLLGALYLAVYQVVNGEKTVGQFATLLSYWAQLQGPLVFFSTVYRSISYSLMDAERLLELFQTKPSIKDIPNAKPIKFSKGKVEFDQVSFAYDDRRPTLKNVSFVVPSGKTVALVGETGGGKSTLLKLIDRFYDVKAGSIRIDGQDLRDVTLSSLREKIGVVPQDPMLFNDSIMNNVRYARQNASDKEVYEACKAAAVHDKIMSFPDGYNSKVGDRGVKVSGGEKQRIAIARAILKQPEIILLDEATSAVDTETEQMIQEGLKALCTDRTTFIVAHRLSTIMRADHILVVMNGEIAEQGHHKDLLASKGKYYDLWTKQIFLRPSDRSRSRSPKKQQGDIVNDLGADQHKAEIKKADVQNKANQLQAKKDAAISNTDGTKYEGGGHKDGGHKKEGSKLRPDVPAFVPRLSEPSETVHTCKEHSKKEKSPKKPDKHPKRSTIATDDTLQSTAEESSSAGPSKELVTDGEADGVEKPKAKRSRYGRRNQAKSEPSSRAQYSTDGAQDSEMTAGSSGEGLATTESSSAQRRRVSAPSEPPVEGRTTRSRRNRHWRLKNRAAENGSSTPGTSGEASLDGSHETQNTTVHNTTPVESAAASTSANVRFAPGF